MPSSLFSMSCSVSFLLLLWALISPSFNQIIGGSKLGNMAMAIEVEDSMALWPFGSASGIGSFSRIPQCGGPRRTIANAEAIGVCYGALGDNLPEPREVVQLYRSYGIKRMRIFYPKEGILNALRESNIELVVSIPNNFLESLVNLSNATNWVQRYIQAYMPHVEFRYIAVGNYDEPIARFVLPAMRSIYNAIAAANLQDQIKVSTVISDGLLASSSPPSLASFTSKAREFIEPILSFLAENGSPLLAHVYPYYAYIKSPQSMSLDYALFTASRAVVIDGKFEYRNLFETILDALYAALEKSGGANVPIVVSESGWPSSGGHVVDTVENAGTYYTNLISFVQSGTPRRPGRPIETYLYVMFDENLGSSEVKNHFGLFTPDKTLKYQLTFS